MDNDYPTSPYSSGEQMRIMRDLKQHIQEAQETGDQARAFYGVQALQVHGTPTLTESEYSKIYD